MNIVLAGSNIISYVSHLLGFTWFLLNYSLKGFVPNNKKNIDTLDTFKNGSEK